MFEAPCLHEPVWRGFSFAQLTWLWVAVTLFGLAIHRRLWSKYYDFASIIFASVIVIPYLIVQVVHWFGAGK